MGLKGRKRKGGNLFVDIGVPVVLASALKLMKSRSKKYGKVNKTAKKLKRKNKGKSRSRK